MKIIKTILFFIFISTFNYAQLDDSTFNIAAGEEYEAGWFHIIFWGKHWRDVWVTPVKTKVLDLHKFANGLTPIKKGGGFQTKSLRFKGNDSHYWKFRSIEKDPSKTLPEGLRNTLASDIVQDQISSSNPYAALVVAPILDSLKVLQAKPYLYYLPDVEELGEFRKEFGGTFGFLEVHPKYDEDENVYYEESDKVKGTLDLFERLEKKKDEYVNSTEYLKARLIDLVIGDWDRHADQWKWARYEVKGKKYWLPIPRDRDQAFSKFDGFFPSIAEYIIPQFNSFEKSFNDIEHLTWNGRFVDQHFLIQLTKVKWDSVTKYVQNKLTDTLIKIAVDELPPEVYRLCADEISEKIKWRRNNISELSNDYYIFINTVVDIYGGNKKDYIEINRINDDQTELKLYKEIEDQPVAETIPYFQKTFDNNITDEIRIYLNDGDDVVKLKGEVDDGILIRIIGGKGSDTIIDSSKVNGYFLSISPINDAENKTKVYDHGKKTKIVYSPGTIYDKEKIEKPKSAEEKYRPLQRDRSGETFFYPVVNYNSDDGFIIGGGSLITRYGFRAVPFKNKYSITAHYATNPSAGALKFNMIFNSILKNVSLQFNIDATQLQYTSYYGFGNETNYSSKLNEENYYRLEQSYIGIHSYLQYRVLYKLNLNLGLAYHYSHAELSHENLLDLFQNGDYGLGKFSSFESNFSIEYDSRDSKAFTQKGLYLLNSVNYFPKILDNKKGFWKGKIDFRTYITTLFVTKTTLAFRLLGEKVWGNYPFLSAAFLGGSENLLSYRRERFSGDAALYGIAQMRMKLAKVKFIIKGEFGFHAFAETGRVFTHNDNSKIWHPGHGGGLWLSYLDRTLNIITTLANSEESLLFYFGLDFNF